MKYLIFSFLLIVAGYAAITLLAVLRKQYSFNGKDALSQDISSVCKGFACCIIMLSHIGNIFGVRYLTPLGSWGVGIFLLFSGYGLELSVNKKGLKGYWKKRMVAAWIPYAVAETIGYLLCITPKYAQPSIWTVLLDMLLIQPVHPFGWYMRCLFLYYIAFYLAHKLFHKKELGRYSVLITLSIAFLIFFKSLYKQQIFTFLLGVLLANNPNLRERITQKKLSAFLLLLSGMLLLILRQLSFIRNWGWVYEIIFSLQVLFLSTGTISAINQICRIIPGPYCKAPMLLGTIALEIYLYHAWVYYWVSEQPISYGIVSIFFVLSILVATAVYFVRTKVAILCVSNTLQKK